jgi:hypothetical protein
MKGKLKCESSELEAQEEQGKEGRLILRGSGRQG